MKKTMLLLLVSMVLGLTGCARVRASSFDPIEVYGSDTLNVFNWGEYIEKDVIDRFEEKYNVKINYSTYDSCEMLYTKLISDKDAYDVIVPADYMIERLIREDLLQPLDYSYMTNIDTLDETALNLLNEVDPGCVYSLPYFVSTAGIVYDKETVSLEDLEKEGWSIMKDERYFEDVYMYDSQRDAFMIALKDLGYSANTEDPNEIMEAKKWLEDLHEKINPSYVTDEVIDAMAGGRKSLALVYSGDAAYITSENDRMGYYIPESGSRIEIDGFAIPKGSKNAKLAHEFINFMLEYENAYDNSLTVGYTSSNKEALKELTGRCGAFEGNSAYAFDLNHPNSEMFHDNENIRNTLADLWVKVKLK